MHRYTLQYIKQVSKNEDCLNIGGYNAAIKNSLPAMSQYIIVGSSPLLDSTGSYIQYLVIISNGKESEICVCI